MSNATATKSRKAGVLALTLGLGLAVAMSHAQNTQEPQGMTRARAASETLSARQQAIVPIAAFAVAGDISRLGIALNQGLDAGLTVSDAREVLVQLYAYAGFPRSLNALAELMKVLEARKQRGIQDAPGREPSRAIPKGEALLAAGTANQTTLAGGPVRGPLFEFAPAIDEYLKTHLFGDIFERDNHCNPLLCSRAWPGWVHRPPRLPTYRARLLWTDRTDRVGGLAGALRDAWGHRHDVGVAPVAPGVASVGLILATGLTPCASAIIILLFAFGQELYLVGVAACLVMAAGMGLTVSLVGLAAVAARRGTIRVVGPSSAAAHWANTALGLAGAAAITALGGLLFLSAWAGA